MRFFLVVRAFSVSCLLLIVDTAPSTSKAISGSKVDITLPDSCDEQRGSDWIQCWSEDRKPLAQFSFTVGSAGNDKKYKRFWTQEIMAKISDVEFSDFEPVVGFRSDVSQYVNATIKDGGSINGPIEYGILQNENGVSALYATWTKRFDNGIEILGGFYQIWDYGKAVTIMVNLPMNQGSFTETSVQQVGFALKSLRFLR